MDDAQSAAPAPTLDELRAQHAAAEKALAEAEAKAAAGPPKTPEQLHQEHEDAKAALEKLEGPVIAYHNARFDHATALQRPHEADALEAAAQAHAEAKTAHDAHVAAHPELTRQIDIAAQAVIDAREALAAHQE
ncbi:MAG TPA: hypothetical protein VFB02_13950 [Bradyrhizobium sp.]|nr:hypothetical protein [Bradyrhizobium sp.]